MSNDGCNTCTSLRLRLRSDSSSSDPHVFVSFLRFIVLPLLFFSLFSRVNYVPVTTHRCISRFVAYDPRFAIIGRTTGLRTLLLSVLNTLTYAFRKYKYDYPKDLSRQRAGDSKNLGFSNVFFPRSKKVWISDFV